MVQCNKNQIRSGKKCLSKKSSQGKKVSRIRTIVITLIILAIITFFVILIFNQETTFTNDQDCLNARARVICESLGGTFQSMDFVVVEARARADINCLVNGIVIESFVDDDFTNCGFNKDVFFEIAGL